MTGTSIVVSKRELDNLAELGHALRDSGYFDDNLSIAQAAVKVLAGRELGLGPVASMRSLHIVEGKIEMSADLLAQRVKAHPRYDYRVARLDAEACVLRFFEDGQPVGVSEFTMGDAENAKLLGRKSQTWERYPRNMLFNRALTNGVAWYCPDVAAGGAILVEGGVTVDTETGEIIEASDELEPVVSPPSRGSAGDGMGESDGESEGPVESEIVTTISTHGEGSEDSPTPSDPPAPDTAAAASTQGTEGTQGEENEPVTEEAAAGGLPPTGSPSSEPAGGSAEHRALSSQVNQLLRHAAAMRWNDEQIRKNLEESYPGMVSMANLTQEQARELIPVWERWVRDTRMTREQQDALKPLCTIADAKKAAEALFGFKVSNLGELTTEEGDRLITKIAAVRAEQAPVPDQRQTA